MKLSSVRIKDFKRFTDLTVTDIPATAKLVVIVGPNGAGKSSLFEAFNYWLSVARQNIQFDQLYHQKIGGPDIADWSQMFQRITLAFHDAEINPQTDPHSARKVFYLRSAYRHEPDFSINQLNRADDMLADSRRPITLISGEARVSDNYQRIISASIDALFDSSNNATTAGEIVERLVGRVREGMSRVFDGLQLDGPGRPLQGGTFLVTVQGGESSGAVPLLTDL